MSEIMKNGVSPAERGEVGKNVIIVNEDDSTEDKTLPEEAVKKPRKGSASWKKYLRPGLVSLGLLTLFCGVVYPVAVTVVAQTIFPVQANGSTIAVTLSDGTQRVYGSELIGQQFDRGYYLLGRDNSSTTNLSPSGIDMNYKVASREERLVLAGYRVEETYLVDVVRNERTYQVRHYRFTSPQGQDLAIPDLLLTGSGSGVDPDVTDAVADWQIDAVTEGRNAFYTPDGTKRLFPMGQRADGTVIYGTYALKADDPDYDPSADPESYLSLRLGADGLPLLEEYAGPAVTFGLDDQGNPARYEGASVEEAQVAKGSRTYPRERVARAVAKYTKPRWLFLFGEPTTNVLCVNLALDGLLSID